MFHSSLATIARSRPNKRKPRSLPGKRQPGAIPAAAKHSPGVARAEDEVDANRPRGRKVRNEVYRNPGRKVASRPVSRVARPRRRPKQSQLQQPPRANSRPVKPSRKAVAVEAVVADAVQADNARRMLSNPEIHRTNR